jgi:tetratricopeptide (TPR) repeat protein
LNLGKQEEILKIAAPLIDVGLAADKGYGHLQVDPALPSYMLSQIAESEKEDMQVQWAEAMVDLVNYLNSQLSKDARIASHLTILELANLLALLEYMKERYSPEIVVKIATGIEQLIAHLHKPKALKKVVQIREMINENIKEWSSAAFGAEAMKIERLLTQGNLQATYDTAQRLLQKSLDEGEDAYSGADYHIAMAHNIMGDVLSRAGSSEQAIGFLEQAILRFGKLADTGNKSAERMKSVSLEYKGTCLISLGKLIEAENSYKEVLKISEKLDHKREVAVSKGQLGTVYMYQEKYEEAIKEHEDAKKIFE